MLKGNPEIRAAHSYVGGYTILTDFVRRWHQQAGADVPARSSVPLKLDLGEAFQFDWSEEAAGVRRLPLQAPYGAPVAVRQPCFRVGGLRGPGILVGGTIPTPAWHIDAELGRGDYAIEARQSLMHCSFGACADARLGPTERRARAQWRLRMQFPK